MTEVKKKIHIPIYGGWMHVAMSDEDNIYELAKRNFNVDDESLKDYDAKFTKLEKDRKAAAKEAGWIRTDITHHEFAEELDGERKSLQLELCKFFLKINKINSKNKYKLNYNN